MTKRNKIICWVATALLAVGMLEVDSHKYFSRRKWLI
jgi:hypothetical protein